MAVVNDYTALISGKSWSGQNTLNAPVVLTYSFATEVPGYLRDEGYSDAALASFQPFNATEQAVARDALRQWADVSGISFVEVTNGPGELVFSKLNLRLTPQPFAIGFAKRGDRTFDDDYQYDNVKAGDVFIDLDHATESYVLLHEIGHALGLKHSFDGDPVLSSATENRINTVMSYTGDYRDTLGLFDVQAIQALYGDASGDGNWSWNPATAELTQTGKATNDTIFGTGQRDIVRGEDGNDRIAGYAGADWLDGGSGDDVIYGGAGNDVLIGGRGNDSLIGSDFLSDTNFNGFDTVDYSTSASSIFVDLYTRYEGRHIQASATGADIGTDTLYGIGKIIGSDFDDVIRGSGASEMLLGGGGNDILGSFSVYGGADVLDGGAGSDWADFSVRFEMLSATLNGENDVVVTMDGRAKDTIRNIENLIGGANNDALTGDSQANELWGLGGYDVLRGVGGNDVLRGGVGKDVLDGGDGVDLADYSDKTVAVIVALSGAADAIVTVGGISEDTIRNIENVQGGSGNDALVGDGQANELRGLGGNDNLTGGAGNDVLQGGAGNDVLDGGAGTADWADYVDKTVAISVTLNEATNATVTVGGVAEDTIRNIENVQGGSGNDVLVGDGQWNELRGLAGDDILQGGAGNDVLDGGAGEDTAIFSGNYAQYNIVVSGQTATLVGPDGTDVVKNVETFVFNDRIEVITGTVRNDDFNGDSKADILWRNDNGDTYLWNSTLTTGVGFTVQDIGRAPTDWHIQGADDFNGDGAADILWRDDSGATFLWNSAADLNFTVQEFGGIGIDWRIQEAADFSGDGKADILWRNDNGSAYLWNSTAGGGFTVRDIGGASNDWHIQDAADFNRDGKADILWRNDNGDAYLWNSAPAVGAGFTAQFVGGASNDWRIQDAADFNRDGKADILWRNDNGDAYLWNSTPGDGFTVQGIGGSSNDWHIQDAADFNRDGKADILWRNDNGDTYLWNSTPTPGVDFTGQDIGRASNDWHIQV